MMATHAVAATATKAMKTQEWFPEITVDRRSRTPISTFSRAASTKTCGHTRSVLIWFLPGVAGDIPTPSLATFQWFWGTDQGTKWDGRERAPRHPLHRHPVRGTEAQQADRRSRRRTGCEGERPASAARTARARSRSRCRLRLPTGGIPIRGTALGWWNANEEGTGNYNVGINGKGEYRYLDEGKRYVAGHVPEGQEEVLRHHNSTSVFPALPAANPSGPPIPARTARAPATPPSHPPPRQA